MLNSLLMDVVGLDLHDEYQALIMGPVQVSSCPLNIH